MQIKPERHATFKAAWQIQSMVFEEGMFGDSFDFSHNRRRLENGVKHSDLQKSEFRYYREPKIRPFPPGNLGTIFTKEGLVVIWNDDGEPVWMETPWGEWWCWDKHGPGQGRHSDSFGLKEKGYFLSQVELYLDPDSVQRGQPPLRDGRSRIRRVGGIELPFPNNVGGHEVENEEGERLAAEWVHLCEEMEPKRYPVWAKYVEADLPLPEDPPDRAEFFKIFRGRNPRTYYYCEKAYIQKYYPSLQYA